MVLIFGWGRGETQDRGDVVPIVCPNCHNSVYLREFRSQKQVSLYFVPIASSGTDVYLACPICRGGVEVPPQGRSAVDAMVVATRMVRTGQLAPESYQAQAERFLAQMGFTSPVVPSATPSAAGATASGGSVSTATAPERSAAGLADRLAGLAKLNADGVLTDDEFAAAKRRVLEE
jgi:uncharacterized protein YbaR (Trm112 family)